LRAAVRSCDVSRLSQRLIFTQGFQCFFSLVSDGRSKPWADLASSKAPPHWIEVAGIGSLFRGRQKPQRGHVPLIAQAPGFLVGDSAAVVGGLEILSEQAAKAEVHRHTEQ